MKKVYFSNKGKGNKYNSRRSTYNGYNYDSGLEAKYAETLDWMIKAKEIKKWERQHKISLDINGVHIANYFIDFKVFLMDGTVEYHEVKGMATDLWRLKWRMTQAIYPDYKLVLIK